MKTKTVKIPIDVTTALEVSSPTPAGAFVQAVLESNTSEEVLSALKLLKAERTKNIKHVLELEKWHNARYKQLEKTNYDLETDNYKLKGDGERWRALMKPTGYRTLGVLGTLLYWVDSATPELEKAVHIGEQLLEDAKQSVVRNASFACRSERLMDIQHKRERDSNRVPPSERVGSEVWAKEE